MDIYFIFDTSGSMDEMGKIHLQRNLARYAIQVPSLAQENCTDFVIRLYQWHQDISDITLQSDGDIPSLTAKGSSSLAELSDFYPNMYIRAGWQEFSFCLMAISPVQTPSTFKTSFAPSPTSLSGLLQSALMLTC